MNEKKSKKRKIPIVKCLPSPICLGGMVFWCPFCKTHHMHGRGNGHRNQHCSDPDSPFRKTGYELKMYPKAELVKLKRTIDQYLMYRDRLRIEKEK